MVNPRVENAVSVADAIDMLDTRIPLLHREIGQITQSLYDTAFREGASQGRQAGIEYATSILRRSAATLDKTADEWDRETPRLAGLLLHLADTLDPAVETEPVLREYREPTEVIRERLIAQKAQQKADYGRNNRNSRG